MVGEKSCPVPGMSNIHIVLDESITPGTMIFRNVDEEDEE